MVEKPPPEKPRRRRALVRSFNAAIALMAMKLEAGEANAAAELAKTISLCSKALRDSDLYFEERRERLKARKLRTEHARTLEADIEGQLDALYAAGREEGRREAEAERDQSSESVASEHCEGETSADGQSAFGASRRAADDGGDDADGAFDCAATEGAVSSPCWTDPAEAPD
jgi:hypothetical protein